MLEKILFKSCISSKYCLQATSGRLHTKHILQITYVKALIFDHIIFFITYVKIYCVPPKNNTIERREH